MTTRLVTQEEFYDWFATVPEAYRLHIKKLEADARTAALEEVNEELKKIKLVRSILTPVAIFAFPAGLVVQRLFSVLG